METVGCYCKFTDLSTVPSEFGNFEEGITSKFYLDEDDAVRFVFYGDCWGSKLEIYRDNGNSMAYSFPECHDIYSFTEPGVYTVIYSSDDCLIRKEFIIESSQPVSAARKEINISPNPFSNECVISFNSEEPGGVYSVKVFNSLGELLISEKGNIKYGYNTYHIKNLPNGNYFLHLKINNEQVQRKLIKIE